MKTLALTFIFLGCSTMTSNNRPTGELSPSSSDLQLQKNAINDGRDKEALQVLEQLKFQNGLDEQWRQYLLGVSYFAQKELDKGLIHLQQCFDTIKSEATSTPEQYRLAGLCLKKIGWFYRNKKEYDKAYGYHSMRFQYVKEYGSNFEVHDALISLDVDAYFLKDYILSEKALLESIQYAQQIKNDTDRYRSLGMAYNNLAGTYTGQKRFDEAITAINQSIDYWQKYEELAGQKEFKVTWAYYGKGDVYENWAKVLKDNQVDFTKEKLKALDSYKKSQELAKDLGMTDSDKKYIVERIQEVESL